MSNDKKTAADEAKGLNPDPELIPPAEETKESKPEEPAADEAKGPSPVKAPAAELELIPIETAPTGPAGKPLKGFEMGRSGKPKAKPYMNYIPPNMEPLPGGDNPAPRPWMNHWTELDRLNMECRKHDKNLRAAVLECEKADRDLAAMQKDKDLKKTENGAAKIGEAERRLAWFAEDAEQHKTLLDRANKAYTAEISRIEEKAKRKADAEKA